MPTESVIKEKKIKNIDTWFFGARVRIVPFVGAESEKEYKYIYPTQGVSSRTH